MSRKTVLQVLVLTILLAASFASPQDARACSGCGDIYIVQWGDTLSKIANRCGTTVSALYAANPGISGYLYAGQYLVMPAGACCNCTYTGYTNVYVVTSGDTFSKIAKRFGVSLSALAAANPHIWDINRIYPGQTINIPYTSWTSTTTTTTTSQEPLVQRSTDGLPTGTPTVKVKLVNAANADAYVSLQGTTKDGIKVINEYPVEGSMRVKVPAGWYHYVAWVGGQKFAGDFNMRAASNPTITFYKNKVKVAVD